MVAAAPRELDGWRAHVALAAGADAPPQNLREYDPEWGKAFVTGSFAASCPHHVMLAHVKVPALYTHHFRTIDEPTGALIGACTDAQAQRVTQLVADTGHPVSYRSFPTMGHSMHGQDPQLFADTLLDWFSGFPA